MKHKYLALTVLLTTAFMPLTISATDLTTEANAVISLMDSGKTTEAAVSVNKLITDNSADTEFVGQLFYTIAEKCRLSDKYENEKALYQQLIQNYPNSSYANKVKLGLARANIQVLILSKDYTVVQAAINTMISDFSSHPDLPDALYWTAERYRWAHKWNEAKDLYTQLIQNYPASPYASKAQLGLARAEVLSSIAAQDYDKAHAAFNRLITDFPDHPDMPETLYWIARGFGYGEKYDIEKNIYQQIIQNYPETKFAQKASLGIERANAQALVTVGQTEEAQQQLVKIKSDFSTHPDLQDAVYWIGQRYTWADGYDDAKLIYQQIIQNNPNSPLAEKANLDLANANILSAAQIQSDAQTKQAIDTLIADFNDNDRLPEVLLLGGQRYFDRTMQKNNQGFKVEAEKDARIAIKIWAELIEKMPSSDKAADAHYFTANAYELIGEYGPAIEHYMRILEDYPGYPLGWDASFKIGRYYQNLKDNENFDKSIADTHTKAAYQNLLNKYPDCPAAQIADKWLKQNSR